MNVITVYEFFCKVYNIASELLEMMFLIIGVKEVRRRRGLLNDLKK